MQSGQPYPQYIDQNHGYTCSGYGTSPNMNSYNQYNLNYGYKSPHPGIYHYTHNQFYNQPPNAYPPYSSFTDGSSAHNNQVSPTDSAISNESYFDAKDHYVFAFFRNFRGKELQLANPALPMRSIARILDEEWSIMDIHQKQYYQTLFEKSTGTNVLKRSSVDSSTDSQGSSAKRPPNPYLLYNREIRPQVQIDYPHLSVGEISKIISAQWKNLTQEEKMKYEVESKRLKREWLLQNKDDAQSAISSSINTDGSVEEEWEGKKPPKRRRKRVNAKDPNQPKHPMSAFLFYLSEVRPSYTAKYPGWTVGPISKMISQAWKELSDQDREKYVKKAYDDKVRYAREMEVFLSRRE
ncbi:hypothetical protein HK098_004717 [Nowakowskiella sp. JEL0407]|nr:hypothetical protein HK098_004717 [Nowakowskiella sp. JEL0407]